MKKCKRNLSMHHCYRLHVRLPNWREGKIKRYKGMHWCKKLWIYRLVDGVRRDDRIGRPYLKHVFSNSREILRHIPERLYQSRFPRRHYKWHTAGRGFGFEEA